MEYKEVNLVPKEYLKELEPFQLIYKKYYYNSTTEVNWFQAAQNCRKRGSNLISLTSEEERQLVGMQLDKNQTYWVDITTLGQSQYVSIATGQDVEYVNWFNDDDDEQIEDEKPKHCVVLVYDKQDNFIMKKTFCNDKARFICQLSSPRTVSILVW